MICYYLKGKNGEYIARDPTGRIKLVSDLGDALLVPEIEKKKIKAIQANNIPDVLKKFGIFLIRLEFVKPIIMELKQLRQMI